ncbi:hypothetical protein EI94DRAFT_1724907 [Lactarius quietus]|nr:hypothetical protein EI94DRAFT_1724907 [Lactarius quietus]
MLSWSHITSFIKLLCTTSFLPASFMVRTRDTPLLVQFLSHCTTHTITGANILLYATSLYVLLRKPGFTSSRPRMFMFGITTFIFILGVIALVLATTIIFQQMQSLLSTFETASDMPLFKDMSPSILTYRFVWAAITRLMYVLCDIVCAWRTVVLWNSDKRVIAILLCFILGTTVAAGYSVSLEEAFYQIPQFRMLGLITVCPTLATNLLSTGLIAWKAWQRRISVKKHLCEDSRFVRADRVFPLLVESGLIYCCVWIYYLISVFTVLPDPGFTAMAFVSGLYPMVIVIIVSMQMSPIDHYSTRPTGVRFSGGPALGQPIDSMRQHVVSIHREYVSDFDRDTQIPSADTKASDEEKSLLP